MLSKPLLTTTQENSFWSNRDICTNFWNSKWFAQHFRVYLAVLVFPSASFYLKDQVTQKGDDYWQLVKMKEVAY